MNPLKILNEHFGYSSFRLHQEAVIDSVLSKNDTFVLMPTGGGKSLCYQIPALMLEGVTIVISPLIALMKDQVDALRANGIEAAFLNSTQSAQEQETILKLARNKKLKLLYLAPERLVGNGKSFISSLAGIEVSLIAIDEAHCISQWGHDFRPDYRMLAQLKHAMQGVPVIALTATADKITQADIIEKLELKHPKIFISSFNRENIRYVVDSKENAFEKLIAFLQSHKEDSGIIYCLSRKSTETLAEDLIANGFNALPYHAGLERDQRSIHQEKFLRDEVRIVVATIAFGMGIDKSNVRYVVHMDLPKNIESYYQETGRAGRDGLDSVALLFYSPGDVHKLRRFATIDGNDEQTAIALKKLDEMGRFGELVTCRRQYILNYFNEEAPDYCGNCDVCLSNYKLYDATTEAQKIISAIVRLGQNYGAGYVVDFLRGTSSSKMKPEHKTLKTFGVGSNLSKVEWNRIIREMTERGFLNKSGGMYPVISVTDKCTFVLNGTAKVMLTKSREEILQQTTPEPEYEADLYRELKDLRYRLAKEQNVQPYIILSDASLMELATYLPQNVDEVSRISGFGYVKVSMYGQLFASVVKRYCIARNLESRISLKKPKREKKSAEKETATLQETFRLFNAGLDLYEIAVERKLSVSTIEGHLLYYVKRQKIRLEQLMTTEKIFNITETIERLGTAQLTPIKDALGESYTFSEIKFVLAVMGKGSDPNLKNITNEPEMERYELVVIGC